jgi:hypothetical protein
MSSVSRQQGSILLARTFSFAQNHFFSGKYTIISKLGIASLAVGAGSFLIQRARHFFAITALPPSHFTSLYLRRLLRFLLLQLKKKELRLIFFV